MRGGTHPDARAPLMARTMALPHRRHRRAPMRWRWVFGTTSSLASRRPPQSFTLLSAARNPLDAVCFRASAGVSTTRHQDLCHRRDVALKSTGLDCASMRYNRQRSHVGACQFPARTQSCDRPTRRCAPVIADTLPPCLRPATVHSPTSDETQPTHKQRTHDFTGFTATAPAQFTTFVAGRSWR